MTFPEMVLLFVAAILGGTLNAVAGGGSFFTFPALVIARIPSVSANATSTVALWPGSVASVWAYRREFLKERPAVLTILVITSLIGGILGALLLLSTSPAVFERILPYLLLVATLLFTFSGTITAWLRSHQNGKTRPLWVRLIWISLAQLIIAVYGGYFGGGIGILMLATLALMGMDNIHVMNALKTLLASCINGIAALTFVFSGIVQWPQAIVMLVGAIVGGYGGAYFARKVPPRYIRIFVTCVGLGLTVWFFIKQ
jgi:uncharacterized membrane protein YfcA